MRCSLSLNSANSAIRSIVWLYYVIRLVVPSHTFLWEKIGCVPIMVLTYQPSAVPIVMHGTYESGVLFL